MQNLIPQERRHTRYIDRAIILLIAGAVSYSIYKRYCGDLKPSYLEHDVPKDNSKESCDTAKTGSTARSANSTSLVSTANSANSSSTTSCSSSTYQINQINQINQVDPDDDVAELALMNISEFAHYLIDNP
jgi:hypothetical protein